MIFQPAILALLVGSILITFMLIYSACYGVMILRRWDIRSGSELQLSLERKTYLISTVMTYAFGFQLASLFLFIYTADHLHPLFVGAMCAAGTLYANPWGYPTLILKIINFLLAGIWLIVNYTDNKAYDYPLIKKKYALLLIVSLFIVTETILQTRYFIGLTPDVITSCCGTLFSSEAQGLAADIITFPRTQVEGLFYSAMALSFLSGIYFYLRGKGAWFFSFSSLAAFSLSVVALISFLCLYFYELPTHHCPFCLLQKEYGYIGYPLYLTLLGGGVSGSGAGVIDRFKKAGSLKEIVPSILRRLALVTLVSYAVFMAIVIYGMIFSNLRLRG